MGCVLGELGSGWSKNLCNEAFYTLAKGQLSKLVTAGAFDQFLYLAIKYLIVCIVIISELVMMKCGERETGAWTDTGLTAHLVDASMAARQMPACAQLQLQASQGTTSSYHLYITVS